MSAPAILEVVKLFVGKRVSAESLADSLHEDFACVPKATLSGLAVECLAEFPVFNEFAAIFFTELSLQLRQIVSQRMERFFFESETLKSRLSGVEARLKSRDDDVQNLEKLVEE